MFIWWNENIDFLFKFKRHSTLTYKWSSGYFNRVFSFFPSTKRTKILFFFFPQTMKSPKVAVGQCMSAIHAHSEVCVIYLCVFPGWLLRRNVLLVTFRVLCGGGCDSGGDDSSLRRCCTSLFLFFRCFQKRRSEWQREPGLVMYCVSVKLHREGFVVMVWLFFFSLS